MAHSVSSKVVCPNCKKEISRHKAYGSVYCDEKCCEEYDAQLDELNNGTDFVYKVTREAKRLMREYVEAKEDKKKLNDNAAKKYKICAALCELVEKMDSE